MSLPTSGFPAEWALVTPTKPKKTESQMTEPSPTKLTTEPRPLPWKASWNEDLTPNHFARRELEHLEAQTDPFTIEASLRHLEYASNFVWDRHDERGTGTSEG